MDGQVPRVPKVHDRGTVIYYTPRPLKTLAEFLLKKTQKIYNNAFRLYDFELERLLSNFYSSHSEIRVKRSVVIFSTY